MAQIGSNYHIGCPIFVAQRLRWVIARMRDPSLFIKAGRVAHPFGIAFLTQHERGCPILSAAVARRVGGHIAQARSPLHPSLQQHLICVCLGRGPLKFFGLSGALLMHTECDKQATTP